MLDAYIALSGTLEANSQEEVFKLHSTWVGPPGFV